MTKKTNGGIIVSYAYVLLNAIIGILFIPYLINKLGTGDYGIYEMIVALSSNISILNFGLGDTAVKYIAKYRGQDDLENQGNVLGIIVSILLLLSGFALVICTIIYLRFNSIYSNSLNPEQIILGKRLFVIAAANVVISLAGGTYANVIVAYEKFVFSRGMEIIKTLLRVLLIIYSFRFMTSAIVLVLIDLIINCVFIFINYIYSRYMLKIKIKMNLKNKDLVKEILVFSGYIVFFIIAREVLYQTDKTIIGIQMSAIAVTIYSVGNKFSTMFNQFGYVLSNMYLPRAMIIMENEANSERKNTLYFDYMVEMAKKILAIMMAIFLGYLLLGYDFIRLWVGDGYYDSFISSIIMILAFFLPILLDSGLAILKAENQHRTIAIAWFTSAFANIVLTWIAVPRFGIFGASMMTLVTSYGINCTVLSIELKRKIGFSFVGFLKKVFYGMIPIIVITIILIILKINIGLEASNWFSLFLQGIIFTFIYACCVYVFYLSRGQKYKIKQYLIKLQR